MTSLLAYPYSGRASDDKLIQVRYIPGSPNLILKVNDVNSGIAQFEILTLIGRKIKIIKYQKGDELVTIQDINDFPEGIYIIIAKDVNGKILSSTKINIAK
jgi:hypothetical protein